MERVLSVYSRPYDANNPVICFDERPCQLIENTVMPELPKPGRKAREDYHYKRNGTCVVLLAVEPLTGKRVVEVSLKKTKKDYARFMKKVSEAWSSAKTITLVQDNLNTHSDSSFYENMKPKQAFSLMSRFEMVFTPKKASWLNMAEIEFSALAKQCLDRRIGTFDKLSSEVVAWTKKRNQAKIKLNWQFGIKDARKKLSKSYKSINKNK